MGLKKLPPFFFLCAFLLSSTLCFGHKNSASGEQERELQECYSQCETIRPSRWCEAGCTQSSEDIYQIKKREEEECLSKCRQREERECRAWCDREYREEQEQEGGGEKKEEEEERKNPFYISRSISESLSRYEEGFVRFLPRFTEISELFRHLESYRFEICEANTRAFVIPHYADVETIFFVSQGRGTVTLVKQNQRESYKVEKGDVMKVDVGTTVYTINHSDKERLQMVKLVQSRNAPGDYEIYFGAGGENPKSFYRVFSDEVLEAAFNTTRDRLQKVFEQQTRGAVVGASEEQIKALTQHAKSSKGSKARGKGPFNLLQSPAIHSNKFGQLFEVTPNDLKDLQDSDSSVSFVQLNQGGMMAPFFNSKATKIVYVVEGNGSFEIVSPQGQGSPPPSRGGVTATVHYEKFNGRLLPGVIVVVPAGYPVTFVASQSENLQLVAFGVNAQNNEKHFLAGKESILNQLEREAMELSFNTRAEEVEQILKNQEDSYFVAAPQGV